mgnify:CR=1 FL=1
MLGCREHHAYTHAQMHARAHVQPQHACVRIHHMRKLRLAARKPQHQNHAPHAQALVDAQSTAKLVSNLRKRIRGSVEEMRAVFESFDKVGAHWPASMWGIL